MLTKSFKTITRMAEAIISVQEAVIILCMTDDKAEKQKCTNKIRKLMKKIKKKKKITKLIKQMKATLRRENLKRYK